MGTSSDSPPGDQGCTLCPSDASGEPGGPGLAGGKCLERKAFVKKLHACGSWSSPIGSADLVQGALRLAAPRLDGDRIFWLEGRPSEGGRQVVMVADLPSSRRTPVSNLSLSNLCEATPPGVNVRTRVHEYGGGEYSTWRDRVFFVDDADGRVYGGRIAGPVTPLVPKGSQYADLVVSPDGAWVFAIEERPREGMEPENRLISIPIGESSHAAGVEATAVPIVVAAGHDFYASPIVAPSSDGVAWLAWDHPNMPWNGTVLERIAWGEKGPRGEYRRVAGSQTESLFQPRFAADGTLFVVSDRSGWWNLYRLGEGEPTPLNTDRSEVGRAQWVFGQSSWTFVESSAGQGAAPEDSRFSILASATVEGVDVLTHVDSENGHSRSISTNFRSLGGLQAANGWATCIAGSATHASALFVWRVEDDQPGAPIRESAPLEIPEDTISVAEVREFSSKDGRTTHAFFYAPRSGSHAPKKGERPPLLVKSHGGPTSATSAALDPRIQYWTSRGFAVADVNYGGSTGYGRAYRDSLAERWGIVDVEDCVAVAATLATDGVVDGERLAISGGSAGGYTTLCALTFHNAFSAGASHYGIGDLEALARDTHKFESRYTDWLVGRLPEDRARYVERSPLHHCDQLACPVIFFQGLEDKVVPPNQAEAMVAVLKSRGLAHAYVPFEGEQHGFRRAENIRTALDGELYFYSRVFGFDADQPPGIDVVGMRL